METVRSADGTTIAFERWGRGPALVVVGGALSDRTIVGELAPHLAGLTVVGYDRRGRGDSGDTAPYAVEREVEDLRAVIDAVAGSAAVFGHSSGAALALEAAAGGLPITKLALYEPPFIVDDTRPPLPDDYLPHLRDLVAAGRRGDAVEYFMTVGPSVPPEVVAQMRSSPTWPALEALAHTIAYDGAVMGDHMAGRPLPRDRWVSVTIPTLVMDGGASPAWARNAVRELAEILPNARRRTLEGQAHGAAPEVLAPVLEDFVLHGWV
ncbi:MAG: alpha/beta fold hydrolase [Candidatus Velamenicoccus archaeovorus]